MYEQNFQNLGLTKTQSAVLNYLFDHGKTKASIIAKNVKHPRGVVYKALNELIEIDLIEKEDDINQISRFSAKHPKELEKIIERKERKLSENRKIFEEMLPGLVSSYNIMLNKPGVKFYEGKEGLEKVLYDTLTSKTEIYLMHNRNELGKEENFSEINEEYKRHRTRAKIKKKIIRIGEKSDLGMTFGTKDDHYDAITEIKYLKNTSSTFKANIHIYDNKISFFIINKRKIIGILIEDKNIFELNKFWFETLWKSASY